MPLAFILVALILSVIELAQARLKSTVAWALLCLSIALLWPHLPLR